MTTPTQDKAKYWIKFLWCKVFHNKYGVHCTIGTWRGARPIYKCKKCGMLSHD